MKFEISAEISLDISVDPSTLLQTLLPENTSVPSIDIKSIVKGQKVVTTVEGTMKIGTLLVIIDDILKTAELTRQVADTTS